MTSSARNLSSISDSDLCNLVQSFCDTYPGINERILIGHLRSIDVHVLRERIRHAIRSSDPLVEK